MAKVTRKAAIVRLSGFFCGAGFDPRNPNQGGSFMKKESKILAYRRRCRGLAGTGLSHYILLTPRPKEAK